jgi:hypothetical protein
LTIPMVFAAHVTTMDTSVTPCSYSIDSNTAFEN